MPVFSEPRVIVLMLFSLVYLVIFNQVLPRFTTSSRQQIKISAVALLFAVLIISSFFAKSWWLFAGLLITSIGGELNYIIIILNDWRMPVIANKKTEKLVSSRLGEYCLADHNTRLFYLADVLFTNIKIGKIEYPSTGSVGDILLGTGVYILAIGNYFS